VKTKQLLGSTVVGATFVTAISAIAGMAFPAAEWEVVTPESQGLDGKLVEQGMERLGELCGKVGNLQTVLVRNGRIVWQAADIDNRHLIWSCTKSFTSVCFGLLWDDGKIAPDDLAVGYYPPLQENYPSVTIEQLMAFTSGYRCKPDSEPFVPGTPNHAPGEAFHYNEAPDLTAFILARLAGKPLQEFFRERIGAPIGIKPDEMLWKNYTTVDGMPLNGGSGAPDGGIHLTARAMARFGWLFCNDGVWGEQRLLSRKYCAYACAVRVPAAVPPFDEKAWYVGLPGRYGLHWWVNGTDQQGKRLWPGAPPETFAAQGNLNNICFVLKDWQIVLVRMGEDENIEISLYDEVFALLRRAMVDKQVK